jgi:hypothetical protein
MTALRDAYHVHDIEGFQSIVANPKSHDAIMGDQFIREHIESLLKLIRTQKLTKIIVPYKRFESQNKLTWNNFDIFFLLKKFSFFIFKKFIF